MLLTLSPRNRADQLTVSVAGDVLVLNGVSVDLSAYDPDTPSPWIVGEPTQATGEWQVTLILPHGSNAPEVTRFPIPITVTDGPVALPPYDAPEE